MLLLSSFIVNVIKCTKIILSEKVFSSIIIINILNAQAIDRRCLNAQCSLITTTWRTPHFACFFDDSKIFVICSGNRGH